MLVIDEDQPSLVTSCLLYCHSCAGFTTSTPIQYVFDIPFSTAKWRSGSTPDRDNPVHEVINYVA